MGLVGFMGLAAPSRVWMGVGCCSLVFANVLMGQIVFEEVGASRGIGPYVNEEGMGSGVAAGDYDGDGFVDLFVPQGGGTPDLVYRNRGDGSFEEVGASLQLGSLDSSRVALWVDYDGDRDLDLFVANDDLEAATSFHLYRQNAGHVFEDVTVASGVFKTPVIEFDTHHWGGICAGDINHDGYVDIFTGQWPGPGHLLLNRADTESPGFIDISDSSGVGLMSRHVHQSVMSDFTGDGWLDIYVAVDFGPNLLWVNQHDNTFVDMALVAGLGNAMNDMGLALGDCDNDGDLDVYITNVYLPEDHPLWPRYNVLLRNDSDIGVMDYVDVSYEMGVEQGHWGWGATFLDVDRDGLVDLAEANGWRSGIWQFTPSRFFLNQYGQTAFLDRSEAFHFDLINYGSSLIAFDFDRDGDQDLMQVALDNALLLFDNVPDSVADGVNYLVVKPRTGGTNHFAIGAVVRVEVGGRRMIRLISAGTSYMGQEPAEAHFGLGGADVVDVVTVAWADGRVSSWANVPVNQTLTFPAIGGDCDVDGDVDAADFASLAACGVGAVGPGCSCSDLDGDGDIDLLDWGRLQADWSGVR